MLRKATAADLPALDSIYEAARAYMRATGNPTQWGTTDPPRWKLERDIEWGELYVICDEEDVPHAAFAFVMGEDPQYGAIEEGDWSSDEPYGTIHRIASDGTVHGVLDECLALCKTLIGYIRADTHENNKTMQHLLTSRGFTRCGTVHMADGSPRWAYELRV